MGVRRLIDFCFPLRSQRLCVLLSDLSPISFFNLLGCGQFFKLDEVVLAEYVFVLFLLYENRTKRFPLRKLPAQRARASSSNQYFRLRPVEVDKKHATSRFQGIVQRPHRLEWILESVIGVANESEVIVAGVNRVSSAIQRTV